MAFRAYRPHELLVAPARHRPQLWRLFVGLALTTAVMIVLGLVLRTLLRLLAPAALVSDLTGMQGQGTTPASMLILLFSFGLVLVGIFAATRLVQDRDPLGLLGPLPLALEQFLRVLVIMVVLSTVVMILPPYDLGQAMVQNLDLRSWLMLLPLSLAAVLVQSGSEEILFRGYIQQTLAARFSSPLIWMVLPAVLFGVGHYVPAEAGSNAGLVALWAVIFGILMADLTARAGTLGPAIALHLVNNITALLIVSTPDSLNGLALTTTPFSMSDTQEMRSWMMVDFALMMVSWLAARLAIRR